MVGIRRRYLVLATAVMVFGLLAAACGGGANAAGGGDLWVRIASPAKDATVSEPFTVTFDASVPIGDPTTGEHHVHLCFDGASCDTQYTLAYTTSIQVDGLTPGEHTIEASLRNADHSDAGPSDTVTITVGQAGAGSGGTPSMGGGSTSSGSDGQNGFGY